MRLHLTRRPLCVLAALVAALVAFVGGAVPAGAAKPVRASVSITSPADGTSGTAVLVPVSGKASSPNGTVTMVVDGVETGQTPTVDSRGAWSTTVGSLQVGDHSICALVRVDDVTLATACVNRTVRPDPNAFAVAWPEQGASVATRFSVSGPCQNGTQVALALDGGSTATVDCSNDFFYQEYYGVAAGSHSLRVEARYAGTSFASADRSFTVVAPPPVVVEVTSPADGSTVDTEAVYIRGTSNRPGQTVIVSINGHDVREAFSDGDGNWNAYAYLTYGDNTICARLTDGEGFTGEGCAAVRFAIDPSRLTIDTPQEGSLHNAFVDFSGQCAEGTTVRISVDSDPWVAEQNCYYGSYSGGLAYVADGERTLTVSMVASQQVVATKTRTFTVDTLAPAPPTIVSPTPGSTIKTRTVTLSGTTAEGGLTIGVLHSDGAPYTTTTSSSSGTWSVVLGEDYFARAGVLTGKAGSVTVRATATDPVGNESAPTSATYTTRIR